MLTALVVMPVVAAIIVGLIPTRRNEVLLPVGVGLSLLPLALSVYLFTVFAGGEPGFQFVEQADWYGPWGISWHLGVDGISLPLVVLTALLVPIALGASTAITEKRRLFVVMTLLLEAGLIGVFLALDLFVFFVFFEAILIPMYFMIGIWGSDRRVYAAIKFFIYTALGSAFMLAGIIALAFQHQAETGSISFDYTDLLQLDLGGPTQIWLFVAFALAFAIKVPLFPFHTWLPDAHVEAPTAGSVLLAGVLLKLGTYGFLRFNLPLFPDASVDLIPVLATLAVIGIIYGAVVAIVQPDLKKLVAYSSVSHLGFIVLGTFALTAGALQGGVIQMINHGITTGALFLLVGMLYDRRHTKRIADFGGLAGSMPIFAGLFLFTVFASIGLPGLNGFVGEFMVLLGSYVALPGWTVVAALGVILAAIYLLWAYQRVFTGPLDRPENEAVPDLTGREIALMVPLVLLMIFLGLQPKILLDRIEPSTDAVIERVAEATGYRVVELPATGLLAEASDD